jgi:drug/metabolite transporter (DMT)-like permease
LLIVIGTCATLGHLVLIKAYRLAAASVIAPYAYVNIVFATIIGYLVYGDFPDHWTLVGTAVVVGSGIYVFYREASVARAARRGGG